MYVSAKDKKIHRFTKDYLRSWCLLKDIITGLNIFSL